MFRCFTIAFAILCALLFSYPQTAWTGSSSVINVQATILSTSNCKFRPPGSAAVDFGTLDPLSTTDVTIVTSLTIRCQGSAGLAVFSITDDDGLNETGPNANRMQHSVDPLQFIPYALTLNPTAGAVVKGVDLVIDITADLLGVDYQNAIAGLYTDTVTVTIVP